MSHEIRMGGLGNMIYKGAIVYGLKFISVAATLFGVYESWKRKKLETLNRQNTWSLYRDASVIFGSLQGMQEKIKNNDDIKLEFGKVISHAENIMNNQIRQININEKITSKKIDRWLKSGKIYDESHVF